MANRVAVITFPGSNGDHDAWHSLNHDIGVPTDLVDYRTTDLSPYSALVLPGGFSYGDYLRCGAIARFAPVMASVKAFAEAGGPVLGICNGFQVLTEAHLLPGSLLRNQSLRFVCEWVYVVVEQVDTSWTSRIAPQTVLRLPVAHGDGAYFADAETVQMLEENNQIVFRYCDPDGAVTETANPNGSVASIAGVTNAARNVVGLMPHPERATDSLVGGSDGRIMLESALALAGVAI